MKTITILSALRFRPALLLNLAASIIIGTAPSARAQQAKDPVTVALVAKKVVNAEGAETLAAAEAIKPGDTLQYEAVYRNGSTGAIRNLFATIPVPEGLALVAESAAPAGALASTDGTNFQPMPLMRAVRQADGTIEKQPVALTEYRALRWSIAQLAAGDRTTVRLRARAVTGTPAK